MNSVGNGVKSYDKIGIDFLQIVTSADMKVTPQEVEKACKRLKTGKAMGPDNIFSESYIHAGPGIYVLLSMLFSAMFVHGIIPRDMMHNVITPIIKDKNKDVTDYNNYRGIALAPISSKIFEFIILDRYEACFSMSNNQFGFKKSHDTQECIFALKEIAILSNYNFDFSSPVGLYVCFVYSNFKGL